MTSTALSNLNKIEARWAASPAGAVLGEVARLNSGLSAASPL